MNRTEPLIVWSIFYNPLDAPGKYVVRRHFAFGPDDIRADAHSFIEDTLDSARERVPLGLVRFERHPQDHSSVIESWL